MPSNLRCLEFRPVGTGTSTIRVRTENTLKLEYGKWYKLEFDLKTSDTAGLMYLRFYTGTTWPELMTPPNHLWSDTASGSPTLRHWVLTGMSGATKSYYETWATVTYYVKSDTNAEVYLHFQVDMDAGTDAYAVKLDNFSLTRAGTSFADTTDPTTTWADATEPTLE